MIKVKEKKNIFMKSLEVIVRTVENLDIYLTNVDIQNNYTQLIRKDPKGFWYLKS